MVMKVPFLDLKRTTDRIFHSAHNHIRDALQSCSFVGGAPVETFEDKLSAYFGGNFSVACANGTDALIIALQASGMKPGMKIGVPNVTFWASYEAIVNIGCIPVLIDIDKQDLQISLQSLEDAITKVHLDGLIIAHLFGWCSRNISAIRCLCAERSIACIEDGAQSFGVELQNSKDSYESIFKSSSIATLSFYPSKVLGGCMDGGAILTPDKNKAALCKVLRDHGRAEHYTYSHVGWNSRMSGTQAIWLSHSLSFVDNFIQERNEAVRIYEALLPKSDLYRLVTQPHHVRGNGYLLVLELNKSLQVEAIVENLATQGVSTGRVYPSTLDQQPSSEQALKPVSLVHSRNFCSRVINLPLFPGITAQEIEYTVSCFLECLKALANKDTRL